MQRIEESLGTYISLRVGMVLVVCSLFLAVGVQVFFTGTPGCYQPSFSAYYYTPVRPVFIAALSVLGAGLLAYRGSTDAENSALNAAGFLALVVAFVPTQIGTNPCDTTNMPLSRDIELAAANNVSTIFIIAFLALLSMLLVQGPREVAAAWSALSNSAKFLTAIGPLALVVGFCYFLLRPELFRENAHMSAAVALFVGVFVVVVINAVDGSGRCRYWYRSLVFSMPISAVVAYGASGEYWAFWVEFVLILQFGIFWVVQSIELRNTPRRAGPVSNRVVGNRNYSTGLSEGTATSAERDATTTNN